MVRLFAAVATFLATLGGLLGMLDPLVGFVVQTAPTWMPLATVFARMARFMPSIPDRVGLIVFVLAALVYVLILLERWASKARSYFDI